MGFREGTGRGGIQVALWSTVSGLCDCKPMKELPIQEIFKFKHYLALQYSLPRCPWCSPEDLQCTLFNSQAMRVDQVFPLHGIEVSHSAIPSILELKDWTRIRMLPGYQKVCWIHTISFLLLQIGRDLPKSNPWIYSTVLNGKACRHATPRSGTNCNHIVSEAAETAWHKAASSILLTKWSYTVLFYSYLYF